MVMSTTRVSSRPYAVIRVTGLLACSSSAKIHYILGGGLQGRGQRNTSAWSFPSQAGQFNLYKNARTAEPIYFSL